MKEISKQSKLDIVKGNVTDCAVKVAQNNDVNLEELITILRQIGDTLNK